VAEKKILVVVPPQEFNDNQYEICRRSLESKGHKVSVASIVKVARGESGSAIPVDLTIKDVKTYDYDAVIFPGGEGNRILYDEESARQLAKDCKYKVIAASDRAVILLSLSGAIEDKKVTGPPESISWIIKGKAKYTGEPITVDDKLITLKDPELSEQMASAVLKALEK